MDFWQREATNNYKFKNVVSVALERLIVDNRKFNIEYTDVNRDYADYPYLSVSVDNLDSLIYGTNETSSKALGIMVAKTPILWDLDTAQAAWLIAFAVFISLLVDHFEYCP